MLDTTRIPSLPSLVLLAALAGCPSAGEAPEDTCPATLGAGTHHPPGALTDDATWAAADSPHHVDGLVSVEGGATLVVEACADVRVAAGGALQVGSPLRDEQGHLVARGAPDRRIRLSSADGAPWAGVRVFAPGDADLAHVDVDDAGGETDFGAAAITLLGDGTTPLHAGLRVDDVVVRGARGDGVLVADGARFAAGSRALTVTEADGHPLVVTGHAVDGLPDGRFEGNRVDEILVVEDGANARPGLQVDVTMRDLGVPYRVGRHADEGLRVGANGGSPATLTIEAGVVLRFTPGAGLRVVSDADAAIGRLRILGEEGAPVVLGSAAAVPAPGDWVGLYFESPMADHEVRHAVVEHAGGWCSCALASCSPLEAWDAAVVLDGEPRTVFMTDSTIRASAGHGFLRSWVDRPDLDFLTENAVEDVLGCAQTEPVHSDEVCPDVAYACGR